MKLQSLLLSAVALIATTAFAAAPKITDVNEALKKAESENLPLPEDVAFFIAQHIRSNVRELEGALKRTLAFARFNNQKLSVPLCKEALKDLLALQSRQVSIDNIQRTVADYYKIKVTEMYSKKRTRTVARPRQI